MDGLLIDSEDIYTLCTNIVLHEYGRPDLPWNIKAQLQGRPGPEAGAIFHRWAQLPLTREAYMSKISILQREHFPSTRPLPGVIDLLSTLSKNTSPRIHIALATSSHSANFRLKTAHLLDLFQVFPRNQLVLGDDERIPRGKGKPAPDIYLLALECINEAIREENGNQVRLVEPNECLVFEDSVPGVEAGRRAGMRVVWVPHEGLLNEYRGREKEVLAGLTGTILEHRAERMGTTREELAAEVKVDVKGKEQTTGSLVEGQPGRIDDGWADLLGGLEDFPYSRYGINVVSVPP
ncbi:MAG: hypothetical protein M1823_003260 [Watsoniomyces obsoletus]|nr:MAG: hypothetical protein M1823_003260 [Watsoniomyces obsoletus]